MKDFSNNFLIAVEHSKKIDYGTNVMVDKYTGTAANKKITLDNTDLFVRFYVNAHFSNSQFRDQAYNPINPVQFAYKEVNNSDDFKAFRIECDKIINQFESSGKGIFYNDGFITDRYNGYNSSLKGKRLGFMWDESFKFDQSFPIHSLPSFTSKLDLNRKKYLLLTDEVYDVIDFFDDIDFYIVRRSGNEFKGVYVSRIKDYAFRMVTHSAYAVDAELVNYYVKTHEFLGDINACEIYIVVRQGGKLRGLYNQMNRIEELYRLGNPEAIIDAMVDSNSMVPEWRADELENSYYATLMRAQAEQIDTTMVQEAYGYSAVTDVMCPPVHLTRRIGEVQQIKVPPALQIPDYANGYARRCVFCYDLHGRLINYFSDASSDLYINIPMEVTGTVTAEIFNGLIDDDSGTYVNMDVVNNDLEQYGFRCYASTFDDEGPIGDWEDITHQNHFYTFTPGNIDEDSKLEWDWDKLNEAGLMPALKTNAKIHLYTYTRDVTEDKDGCLDIIVKARQVWGGDYRYRKQEIPPAQVAVFASGMCLIEDIDYYMDWPRIVIVNEEINRMDRVEIIVRSYGCGYPVDDGPAKPFKPREIGFVKKGRLSKNDRYDIHNDKNLRVTVAGAFKRREQVSFAEDDQGLLSTDGRPYCIEDYILPIENFTVGRTTNEFYLQTVETETRVSDYLTKWLPEPTYGQHFIEQYRWRVISPVLASMCYAILNGYAIDANTNENFDSIEVEHWLKPYEWMLEFDPAYLNTNLEFIHIAPHPYEKVIEMTQKQYELLEAVIRIKLNGLVDLSKYVKIKQEEND